MTTFHEAASRAQEGAQLARSNMDAMLTYADEAYQKATDALDELGERVPPILNSDVQDPGAVNDTNDYSAPKVTKETLVATLPDLTPRIIIDIFGAPVADRIVMDEVGEAPKWAEFDPNVTINLNDIKVPGDLDLSKEPEYVPYEYSIVLPDLNIGNYPEPGALDPVLTPKALTDSVTKLKYTPLYETLVADKPSFSNVDTSVNWSEPVYVQDILPSIREKIADLLSGKGLPPEVERALVERAAEREEGVTSKLVKEAFSTWAGKGFSMPPGMLVEQVNAAQQEMALKRLSLNREVMLKNWDLMYENLKFAVGQGMAYEGVLIHLFENAAKRSFEALIKTSELNVSLYEASVALYNARVAAWKASAENMKTARDVELGNLEMVRSEIESERLRGEQNTQRVQIYAEKMRALGIKVEVHKARLTAELSKLDIAKQKLEEYRTHLSAWSEKIGAKKTEYDLYSTRVAAESSKANLLQSTASAFAATVSGYSATVDAKSKKLGGRIAEVDAKMKLFLQRIEAQKMKTEVLLAEKKLELDRYSQALEKYKIDNDINTGNAANEIKSKELKLRKAISEYEMRMKRWQVQIDTFYKQVEISRNSMEVVAKTTSAITQGALSAIHTSASVSAGGTVSAGFQETQSSKT